MTSADAALGRLEARQAVEEVGIKTLNLVTHPDKRVSQPIQRGIEKSVAAHAKLTTAAEFAASLPTPPLMSFEDFKSMSHQARSAFARQGGRIAPEPEPQVPPIPAGANKITLAQFKTLSPAERSEYCRRGGKLTE